VSKTDAIRIVDFSTHISGPLATHLLTELGATVIKVENPRYGDGNRDGDGQVIGGVGMFHAALNSGARSMTVDRHSAEWPEIIAACARWADAVVVGARPSDARKRGMDFATMVAANPRIIYCALSGFGDEGPWRNLPAHGQTIDAYAGLLRLTDDLDAPETVPGWRTAGTTLGGVFAAMGVLAALHRRPSLDRAQYVSVPIWQTAMWWSWRDSAMLANTGQPWLDYGDLGSRYAFYTASDDRALLLAPTEKRFWEPFCDLLGLDDRKAVGDWAGSGMCYGQGPEFDAERIAIRERVRTRTRDEWTKLLEAADIPFAPAYSLQDALESEHAQVNGVLRSTTTDAGTVRIPAIPVRFAADDKSVVGELPPLSAPPGLGEHNAQLRHELGLES
jgi:crotonobetainyl-CoA:carnitine CoA-transferase CaiB-like acyl-CoA transferase